MFTSIANRILDAAVNIYPDVETSVNALKHNYNIILTWKPGVEDLAKKASQILSYFKSLSRSGVVRSCKIYTLTLDNTMGASKPYSPNHGFYVNNSVTLNDDMFQHPDTPEDFTDGKTTMTRIQHTLIHEFGHGYDEAFGELSLKPEWLQLSGWSLEPKSGLMRLHIPGDADSPEVWGEWYYDPTAGFPRFYAKRNPYDDWADCFTYYLVGLDSKLPKEKIDYFKKLL